MAGIIIYAGIIFGVFVWSILTAYLSDKEFSQNIFLATIGMGIAILVWASIIPMYGIFISISIIGVLILKSEGEKNE